MFFIIKNIECCVSLGPYLFWILGYFYLFNDISLGTGSKSKQNSFIFHIRVTHMAWRWFYAVFLVHLHFDSNPITWGQVWYFPLVLSSQHSDSSRFLDRDARPQFWYFEKTWLAFLKDSFNIKSLSINLSYFEPVHFMFSVITFIQCQWILFIYLNHGLTL